jgi:hypothetical protein
VVAYVAGHRVRTKLRGRRVTITLPAGRKGTVRVLLRVRRQGGSHVKRVRRTFRRC